MTLMGIVKEIRDGNDAGRRRSGMVDRGDKEVV